MAGSPSELGSRLFGGCDQLRRVARASRSHLDRYPAPRNPTACRDHFENRAARFGAKIILPTINARTEAVQGKGVGFGKIADVNVIPYA